MKTIFLIIFTIACTWLVSTQLGVEWPQIGQEAMLPQTAETPQLPALKPLPEPQPEPYKDEEISVEELEYQVFKLINSERGKTGISATHWDEELYQLSKQHTQKMAEREETFHSPEEAYGENCWGGKGYYYYGKLELAEAIVSSWLSSPLHSAWLLHKPIKTSVVSIVTNPVGQYASWTFWMDEIGDGPDLIRQKVDEWERETGRNMPWIDWLQSKGYID